VSNKLYPHTSHTPSCRVQEVFFLTFKVWAVNDTIQSYKFLKISVKTMSHRFRLAEGTNGQEDDEADVERLSD
jgi:hypothetical protein